MNNYGSIIQNYWGGAVVVGIDRGQFQTGPQYRAVRTHPSKLLQTRQDVFDEESLTTGTKLFYHSPDTNLHAIYYADFEQVFKPDTTVDLLISKFMLLYLFEGGSRYVQRLFSRSRAVLILDYIGRPNFPSLSLSPGFIIQPSIVAPMLDDRDISLTQGRNYFFLYARKR